MTIPLLTTFNFYQAGSHIIIHKTLSPIYIYSLIYISIYPNSYHYLQVVTYIVLIHSQVYPHIHLPLNTKNIHTHIIPFLDVTHFIVNMHAIVHLLQY